MALSCLKTVDVSPRPEFKRREVVLGRLDMRRIS
jgi:hypothetical protein